VAASAPRIAVVQFPGTNCERETVRALGAVCDVPVDVSWHAEQNPVER
jgi:phosphoribosylformylglycinamidine (FGAM) synthase-like amidotransferase family enzyme